MSVDVGAKAVTEEDEEEVEEEAPEDAPSNVSLATKSNTASNLDDDAQGDPLAHSENIPSKQVASAETSRYKAWQQTMSSALRSTSKWPRRVRLAVAGYLAVLTFGVGTGLALIWHQDRTTALVVGLLLAGPIVVALIGDRITGIKAFSVEISLAQVTVSVEGDFSGAVMSVAEMGPSGTPDLLKTLSEAIRGRARILRLNLRDEDYWWSTRVFLAAALAGDYTSVEAIVFVRSGDQRIFVGIATPKALRARIGGIFPPYEVVYRKVRFEVTGPPTKTSEEEVSDILLWRWGQSLTPSETAVKVIVTRENLEEWLGEDLDTDDLPYGPLSPLLRYRISSRHRRYAALTQDSRLIDIVDRDELARRITVAGLEQTLQ